MDDHKYIQQSQSLDRKFNHFKSAQNYNLAQLDRVERTASYILSFFASIAPIAITINDNKTNLILNSEFKGIYLASYLLVVLGSIIAIFPSKHYRFQKISMSQPSIDSDNYMEQVSKSDSGIIIKLTGTVNVILELTSRSIIKANTFAKISYVYLGIFFIFLFFDLVNFPLLGALLRNIVIKNAIMIIPLVLLLKEYFAEISQLKLSLKSLDDKE